MGHGGRARSPEARPGVGRPVVTGTARRWYHGDLQIYYVRYARASIYAFRALVHRRKTWRSRARAYKRQAGICRDSRYANSPEVPRAPASREV